MCAPLNASSADLPEFRPDYQSAVNDSEYPPLVDASDGAGCLVMFIGMAMSGFFVVCGAFGVAYWMTH